MITESIKLETELKETFDYKIEDKNYKLILILNSDYISLNVSDSNKFMQSYEINLNLDSIKKKAIIFSKLNSLVEFLDIIKDCLEKKEIIISKLYGHKILFEFKKHSVSFELTKKYINVEELVENLNIKFEKINKKLYELEITKKQEIDEQKKKK